MKSSAWCSQCIFKAIVPFKSSNLVSFTSLVRSNLIFRNAASRALLFNSGCFRRWPLLVLETLLKTTIAVVISGKPTMDNCKQTRRPRNLIDLLWSTNLSFWIFFIKIYISLVKKIDALETDLFSFKSLILLERLSTVLCTTCIGSHFHEQWVDRFLYLW